jgi:hypothetical protein
MWRVVSTVYNVLIGGLQRWLGFCAAYYSANLGYPGEVDNPIETKRLVRMSF